jgi:hypothetical protein
MGLTEIGWDGVECIHLAQDREQWQALVNTGRTIRFWCHIVNTVCRLLKQILINYIYIYL